MKSFKLNSEKAINSMLYVIKKLADRATIHRTFKVLYFSDRESVVINGFPITGDTYTKMEYGPVPSYLYSVTKNDILEFKNLIHRNYNLLSTEINANTDYLSESDVEILDISIERYRNKTFEELTELSHDTAWEKADWPIDYVDMAKSGGANDEMIKYINQALRNENISA